MDGKRGIGSVGKTTNVGDMSGEGVQQRAKLVPRSRRNIDQNTTPANSSTIHHSNGGDFMSAPPADQDDDELEEGEILEDEEDAAKGGGDPQEQGDGSGEGQQEAGEANNQDDNGSDASTEIQTEEQAGANTAEPANEPEDESEDEPVVPGFKPNLPFGNYNVTSGNQAEDGDDSGAGPTPGPAPTAAMPQANTAQEATPAAHTPAAAVPAASASTAPMPQASTAQEATPNADQGPSIFHGQEPMDADMDDAADGISGSVPPQTHDHGTPASAPEFTMGDTEVPMPSMHQQESVEPNDTNMFGWSQPVAEPMPTPMPMPMPEPMTTAAQGHQAPQAASAQEQAAAAAPYENDQQQEGTPAIKGYLLDVCQHMQDLVAPLATAEGQGIRTLELHTLLQEANKALKANGDDGREKMRVVYAQASNAIIEGTRALGGSVDQLAHLVHRLGRVLYQIDRRFEREQEDTASSKKRKFDEMLIREKRVRKPIKPALFAAESTDVHLQEYLRVLSEKMDNVGSTMDQHARQESNTSKAMQELRVKVESNTDTLNQTAARLDRRIGNLEKDMAEVKQTMKTLLVSNPHKGAMERKLEIEIDMNFRGSVRAPSQTHFAGTMVLDLSNCHSLRSVDTAVGARFSSRIIGAFEVPAAASMSGATGLPSIVRTMRTRVKDYKPAQGGSLVPVSVVINSNEEYENWLERMAGTEDEILHMCFEGVFSADASVISHWEGDGFKTWTLKSSHGRWFTRG